MGRVSLTEAYDDRSVIAKLNEMDKRVTENTTVVTSAEASAKASAQAAQETADRFAGSVGAVVQNANAQMNASKAQVDQAKAEVDEAVNTVAGYDTRLTAVENADTQNVKLSGAQTITGMKTVPTEATGTRSQQIANSAKVGAELDNYAPMVRTTGNQTVGGVKEFTSTLDLRTGFNSEAVTSEGYNILKVLDRSDNSIQEGSVAFSRNVNAGTEVSRQFMQTLYKGTDYARLSLELLSNGTARVVLYKSINGVASASTVVTL